MLNKKIGIICTSSAFGGLEMVTLQLAEALKEKGWQIFFLLNEKSKLYQSALKDFDVTSVQEYNKQKNHSSIVKKWNRKHQLHLLFTSYNKDIKSLAAYKILYNNKVRLVYQQHMKVGVEKRDLVHRLRYSMLDCWITPLEYLKQEALEKTTIPTKKIHIIPLGLEFTKLQTNILTKQDARRELNLPSDTLIVGILGRLDPQKGQDFLIKVIASFSKALNVHLLIMGALTAHEGQEWIDHLKQLVASNRVSDRVHFRPYQDDVTLFYSAIDVFAMSSHGETYGLVTLEAMYFEKPVIGVNRDGTRALLQEGELGWLHPLEDQESFKHQLNNILQDTSQTREKIQAAKDTVIANYDFKITVIQMDDLFSQMLLQ